ncbi:hypothetical protein IJT93_04985 [bacterium]|nr:hypothetical protein [bacterium]
MDNENIVPVKTESLRIYQRGGETCVVDLEYGRSMVLNETEKSVFKLCSGGASLKRIAGALNLPLDSAAETVKKFMEHRFIVSYTGEDDENQHFLSPSPQVLICDCKELDGGEAAASALWREKIDGLCAWAENAADVRCGSADGGTSNIVFIKNFDWRGQSAALGRLLEAYADFPSDRENAAPFKLVCEIFSLPKADDFIEAEAEVKWRGADLNLSAVGRLWCLFHRFGAQLILLGNSDFWRQAGDGGADTSPVRRQELNTGDLDMPSRCAETAAMLYETSLRIWGYPESEGGRHFLKGLSIMPTVLAADENWDGCLRFLAESGYRTLGVRFAETLLKADYLRSEAFRQKLSELLDYIGKCRIEGRHIAIYPFERWRRIVRGSWPRSKSRRALVREYETKGQRLPLACRRCPAWYYCFASVHFYDPLPCEAIKALTERALWNT